MYIGQNDELLGDIDSLADRRMRLIECHFFLVVGEGGFVDEERGVLAC